MNESWFHVKLLVQWIFNGRIIQAWFTKLVIISQLAIWNKHLCSYFAKIDNWVFGIFYFINWITQVPYYCVVHLSSVPDPEYHWWEGGEGGNPEIVENVENFELFLFKHPKIVQNFPWEERGSRIFEIDFFSLLSSPNFRKKCKFPHFLPATVCLQLKWQKNYFSIFQKKYHYYNKRYYSHKLKFLNKILEFCLAKFE